MFMRSVQQLCLKHVGAVSDRDFGSNTQPVAVSNQVAQKFCNNWIFGQSAIQQELTEVTEKMTSVFSVSSCSKSLSHIFTKQANFASVAKLLAGYLGDIGVGDASHTFFGQRRTNRSSARRRMPRGSRSRSRFHPFFGNLKPMPHL
jgi:hypothetical protein